MREDGAKLGAARIDQPTSGSSSSPLDCHTPADVSLSIGPVDDDTPLDRDATGPAHVHIPDVDDDILDR